ncbi:hypothetical protein ACFU3K_40485, partial [Streptomyces shenzhenensis]
MKRYVDEIVGSRARQDVPDAMPTAALPYEVTPDIAADAIDEWLDLVQWAQAQQEHNPVPELRGRPSAERPWPAPALRG